MTSMAEKIAAIKAQQDAHNPSHMAVLSAAALLASSAVKPRSKHRLGMKKSHVFTPAQWKAMRKRRKTAQASRRRNRR